MGLSKQLQPRCDSVKASDSVRRRGCLDDCGQEHGPGQSNNRPAASAAVEIYLYIVNDLRPKDFRGYDRRWTTSSSPHLRCDSFLNSTDSKQYFQVVTEGQSRGFDTYISTFEMQPAERSHYRVIAETQVPGRMLL